MTLKETQAFASELKQMDAVEVRENTDAVNQPDAVKRSMAVTELERRRQTRAPGAIKDPSPVRVLPYLILGCLVAGAAYWHFV